MRKPNCENMQHRLLEAYEVGDVEVLRDAARNGLVFFSAMLDRAAVRGHIPCMDVITGQKHVCVSGLARSHRFKIWHARSADCVTTQGTGRTKSRMDCLFRSP